MLDKFLKKINSSSNDHTSVNKKIEDYNSKVREEKKKNVISSNSNLDIYIPERYIDRFNEFQNIPRTLSPKFNKVGKNPSKFFPRPNTYQASQQRNYDNNFQERNYQREPSQQFQRREYIDDGSYFCSYAVGGNTLVCYKNKEKVEFLLEGISHPDKNNYLAKRANYFLNDLVKKQKVYIDSTENGTYHIFLDSQKKNCVNTILINEGYHNSEPYNAESKNKKTSFSKYKASDNKNNEHNQEEKDSNEQQVVKEKKNYAYGLFATDHNTFEALFNKEKIILKIDNVDNISKEHKKICKSMIYDFISKKSIILKFLKEENGIHFVEVYNKEGECLNKLIEDKKFPVVQTENKISSQDNMDSVDSENSKDNEQCSENDWNWVDSDNNGSEVDIPEVTSLPAMFKTPTASKPNSPFKKKTQVIEQNLIISESNNNIENFGEEVDIPEVTSLPAMFKTPTASKPNSPFKKKTQVIEQNSIVSESNNNVESFGEVDVPEVTSLPAMFKIPTASKPNSPFKKNNKENSVQLVDVNANLTEKNQEENIIVVKKKLSFGKR